MVKSRAVFFSSVLLLPVTAFFLALIEPTWVLPLILFATSFGIGYLNRDLSGKVGVPAILLCLVATAIWFALGDFGLGIANPLPFLAVGSYLATSFAIGQLSGKGKDQYEIKPQLILLLAGFTFLGASGFSAPDRFVDGALAPFLLYAAVALLFGKFSVSFWKSQLMLLPLAINFGMYLLGPDYDSTLWIVLVLRPLLCIFIFNLAYFGGRSKRALKYVAMSVGIALASLYFLFLNQLMFGSSWLEIKEPVKPFSMVNLAGDSITNVDIAGKVVWVSFYNNRCRPCLTEMEHVAHVAEEFKGNPAVDFLSVCSSTSDTYEKFRDSKIFHSFGLMTCYEAEPNLSGAFAPNGVPIGILIDRKGVAVFKKDGFMETETTLFEEKLAESIKSLL